MKITFKSEDQRKDKLFAAWGQHLDQINEKFADENKDSNNFETVYEGLATISSLSKNFMGMQFESGEIARYVHITSDISRLSRRLDTLYLILGKYQKTWWPLEVISIGSIVGSKKGGLHFSINPRLIIQDGEKSYL